MVLTCSMRSNQHEFLWDWDHGLGSFLVKMERPGMCQAHPCAERNHWQDARETILCSPLLSDRLLTVSLVRGA